MNLANYNKENYHPGRSKLKCLRWYFVNVIFFRNPLNPLSKVKVWLLRLYGAKVGKGVVIKPAVNIKYPWRLTIGDYSWIGENVWIDNLADVTIASNVCVSQGAMLLTGNHNYKLETFDLMTGEIKLEEGSWVGARAVVCPGVTLHRRAVLTVNSVATEDLEENGVYQGTPAKYIRKRNSQSALRS
jgi:putative colanic acid biosynthesis acetyltransferase WcaF